VRDGDTVRVIRVHPPRTAAMGTHTLTRG
jgi:hypothetical protein